MVESFAKRSLSRQSSSFSLSQKQYQQPQVPLPKPSSITNLTSLTTISGSSSATLQAQGQSQQPQQQLSNRRSKIALQQQQQLSQAQSQYSHPHQQNSRQHHPTAHPRSVSMTKSASNASTSTVKETHHVHVEYDPVTRKRVLNSYEILRDLGSGQHGKVKLAMDTATRQLVAIKIVDRKSKPKLGRLTRPGNSQEDKIRREIAIMKKCDHVNVVKLIEVLDAETSRKIYLVLEFCERGEIEWQRKDDSTNNLPEPMLSWDVARHVFREVVVGLE
ncbi:unnamed protein product [Ambrosiozyma monospora]|uniref:Unnamed protein product n=1 Tax=Ambrosiozyma monospora TaxID=43982 RepID=A0ACB5TZV4_AMBMO|nr:unnamed protein product [Ambrosiozyma monospora]